MMDIFVSCLLLIVFVAIGSAADESVTAHTPPYVYDGYPIVIVGSGLAGHSSAAELQSLLSESGLNHPIIVLEKEARFGGNSMKATSGINGAETDFQQSLGIADSVMDFEKDTIYSATGDRNRDINALVDTLTHRSASAIHWLRDRFELDLSTLSQCGGHSHARTHRFVAGPVGNMIVKAIHGNIESESQSTAAVEWRYNCELKELLMDTDSKSVIGVRYRNGDSGEMEELYAAAIVLASGGYANDHTQSSLLDRYSRNAENELPTTNGGWATGDGVKIGSAIGAQLVDMSAIQVHPTGFVNPTQPDASSKILAPEALRGVGAILVDNTGVRFVNELDLRSKVVAAERQNSGNAPFRLLLNDKMVQSFGPNIGFYIKMGLVKKYESVMELADDTAMDVNVLRSTLVRYTESATKGDKDRFGKSVFPETQFSADETIYAAIITPVIHYTMGGLAINDKAQVLDMNGDPLHGLFGAGEVTGGVHGANRLAGNSLLECVVFGRISAQSVVNYCKDVVQHKKLVSSDEKHEL